MIKLGASPAAGSWSLLCSSITNNNHSTCSNNNSLGGCGQHNSWGSDNYRGCSWGSGDHYWCYWASCGCYWGYNWASSCYNYTRSCCWNYNSSNYNYHHNNYNYYHNPTSSSKTQWETKRSFDWSSWKHWSEKHRHSSVDTKTKTRYLSGTGVPTTWSTSLHWPHPLAEVVQGAAGGVQQEVLGSQTRTAGVQQGTVHQPARGQTGARLQHVHQPRPGDPHPGDWEWVVQRKRGSGATETGCGGWEKKTTRDLESQTGTGTKIQVPGGSKKPVRN